MLMATQIPVGGPAAAAEATARGSRRSSFTTVKTLFKPPELSLRKTCPSLLDRTNFGPCGQPAINVRCTSPDRPVHQPEQGLPAHASRITIGEALNWINWPPRMPGIGAI
jgi:hypothetical protein